MDHFKAKGYQEADLIACGLLTEREDGQVYDRFRHRITFPIRDERGRMAGFGARILRPDDLPKYLNSPQTPLFDKGKLLYGLDRARKPIRSHDQVVVVEGYMDVVALHQHGHANTVSPMGTALTEQQLRLIKRFTRNITLALDPDAAGIRATLRGLELARQTLDRETDPVFDARGLLRHEARLKADIRVTTLPEGMDPDDVVNRDPKEWENILENAHPIVVHVMRTLAADRNLEDPKVKNEITERVLPLIEDLPNPIERDTYRQRLARLLRVDERALILSARPRSYRGRRRTTPPPPPESVEGEQPPQKATSVTYAREAHCLGTLIRRPELIYHQIILRLIQKSLEQDESEPQTFILNNIPMSLMGLTDDILARTEDLLPNDEAVLEDLLRALLSLRQRNLRQNNDYLRFLLEDGEENDDPRVKEYRETVLKNAVMLQRLDKAYRRYKSHSFRPGV